MPDTSVVVGYLRYGRYRQFLITGLRRNSLFLPGVVLCELYAGAMRRDDWADLEKLRRALGAHVLVTESSDWVLAGRCLSWYAARWGKIRPRDHLADVLVAVAATRVGASLATEDVKQMSRWGRALRKFGHPLRLRSVSSSS